MGLGYGDCCVSALVDFHLALLVCCGCCCPRERRPLGSPRGREPAPLVPGQAGRMADWPQPCVAHSCLLAPTKRLALQVSVLPAPPALAPSSTCSPPRVGGNPGVRAPGMLSPTPHRRAWGTRPCGGPWVGSGGQVVGLQPPLPLLPPLLAPPRPCHQWGSSAVTPPPPPHHTSQAKCAKPHRAPSCAKHHQKHR